MSHYICKFKQVNLLHHELFHFHLPFESGQCRKEWKKLQKLEYFDNENSFSDETKNIFHIFQRAIIW